MSVHSPHAHPRRPSLICASARQRLLGAVAVLTLMWALVLWALR